MAEKELSIKFTGDTKDLKSKISDLGKTITTATQQGSNGFKVMGLSLSSIAATLSAGFIAKKIFDIGASAIKTAGQFEQFDVAFSTMLGSGERAKTLLGQIKSFAASTPFELPQVIDASKQLLAFGFSAEEVIPTLTTLGNISAGLGVPISRLNLVFGQVRASGKLMGQDLMQFTNAGVPIIDALSTVLKKPPGAIKDMVSAGKVGFKEVQMALQSLGGEGGKFGGLMIAQSKTIGGVFSNISDNMGQIMLEIGNSLLPIIKIIAIEFLNALNKVREWFAANQASIKNFIFNLIAGVMILGQTAFVTGKFLLDYLIMPMLEFIKSPIGKVIMGIVAAYAAWTAVTWLLFAAQAALQTVNPLAWVVAAIAVVIIAINFLRKNWKAILDFIVSGFKLWWSAVKKYIGFIIKIFTGDFLGAFNDVMKAIDAVVSKIKGAFNIFGKNKKVLQTKETENTVKTVERVQKDQVAPETPVKIDKEVEKNAADNAKSYQEAFKQAILEGGDIFTLIGQVMGEQIVNGLIDTLTAGISSALAQVGQFITDFFINFITKTKAFQNVYGAIVNNLSTLWKGFTESMLGQFLGTMGAMIVGIITFAISTITAFANIAAGAAASAVAGIPIIGPALAIGAYFGTLALVMAGIGNLVGLAEGTGNVIGGNSGDTVPAMLTPGEMVVPKTMAEGIRAGEVSLGGGGGAGSVVNNISFDGANFNGNAREMVDEIESMLVEKFNILGSKITVRTALG